MPILKVLISDTSVQSRQLADTVGYKYYSDLPNDLKEKKTSSGAHILTDRILWGKSYVRIAKFVHYPRRGFVEITEKGKIIITGVLTLKELQNDVGSV